LITKAFQRSFSHQSNRVIITAHLWVDLSHHYRDWANLLPRAPEQGTKPGLGLALLGCALAKKSSASNDYEEVFWMRERWQLAEWYC